jgi:hypothetical protein
MHTAHTIKRVALIRRASPAPVPSPAFLRSHAAVARTLPDRLPIEMKVSRSALEADHALRDTIKTFIRREVAAEALAPEPSGRRNAQSLGRVIFAPKRMKLLLPRPMMWFWGMDKHPD